MNIHDLTPVNTDIAVMVCSFWAQRGLPNECLANRLAELQNVSLSVQKDYNELYDEFIIYVYYHYCTIWEDLATKEICDKQTTY